MRKRRVRNYGEWPDLMSIDRAEGLLSLESNVYLMLDRRLSAMRLPDWTSEGTRKGKFITEGTRTPGAPGTRGTR